MPRVLLGLGSNLGDRAANIELAITALKEVIQGIRVSSLMETAPMYLVDQPPFLNGAALGFTDLGPMALLAFIKSVETRVGRQPRKKYGPREIDIDLLGYGSLALQSSGVQIRELAIPHALTHERRFVLEPVSELEADFLFPGLGTAISLLNATNA